ncbi:MAG: HTTM domain-containing protein [Pirellulaceae bacterium]|jgi:hypothetical protein|nr:HTTM domain-containing protein [Pirellulaceae bacterium]
MSNSTSNVAVNVARRSASEDPSLARRSTAGIASLTARFDNWLFAGCHPTVCSILRIATASVLLVYLLTLYGELEYWFTDAGVLKSATAEEIGQGVYGSLLFWLPSDLTTVKLCWSVMFIQTVLLWLGCLSRFQVACLFVWLVSFQHRNSYIFDGQDTLLRILTFSMIFMPLDTRWSLGRWLRNKCRSATAIEQLRDAWATAALPSAWGLRLVQLQVTAMYLSTAWEKYRGLTWRDGTALFYVSRMDDLYGRVPLPDSWFETPWLLAAMTWGVLATEAILPFALWWKPTRLWALLAAIGLHLSIEITMHIFLFEWLMIVSLLSFLPITLPTSPTKVEKSN